MTIHIVEKINLAPCLRLAIDGWIWLDDRGWTDGGVPILWDDKAIYYEAHGLVLGVLTFALLDYADEIFVKIGYVHPAHRQQGIYRELFACLVQYAVTKQIKVITGGRHINNEVKAKADRQMGRQDQFIQTSFMVPNA